MSIKNYFIYIICACLFLVLATICIYYYYTSVDSIEIETKLININKGESVRTISRKLKNNHIINSDNFFLLYVMVNGYQKNLKAGEYEFTGNYSIKGVVTKILNHEIKLRRVTIPEGSTLSDIGDIFDKYGLFTKNQFMETVRDDNLKMELLKPGVNSFEGILFPDTYYYWKGIKPDEMVKMMVQRKEEVMKELREENGGKESPDNLDDYEILILASIIEKESSFDSERELVSSVFHNRLRIGMKLDSDPTVIYGLGDNFDGNLKKSDLETYTEYNTYMKPGLPPTPISNPGKSSLHAALYPANTQYLYFVSRGDGTHKFSKNYSDHRKAVNEYQLNHKIN